MGWERAGAQRLNGRAVESQRKVRWCGTITLNSRCAHPCLVQQQSRRQRAGTRLATTRTATYSLPMVHNRWVRAWASWAEARRLPPCLHPPTAAARPRTRAPASATGEYLRFSRRCFLVRRDCLTSKYFLSRPVCLVLTLGLDADWL